MVITQPAQEFPGRIDLGRIDLTRAGRRLGGAEFLHRVQRAPAHRVPVGHRLRDPGQHLAQTGLDAPDEFVPRFVTDRGRDLEVHPGFRDHPRIAFGLGAGQHLGQPARLIAVDEELGVEHLVQAPAVPGQLHRHRVDQERVVVGDDLDDGRAVRAPAVSRPGRVEDRDRGLAGAAFEGQLEVRFDQPEQTLRAALVDVVGVDVAEVVVEEGRDHLGILPDLAGDGGATGRDRSDLLRLLSLGTGSFEPARLDVCHAHLCHPIRSVRPGHPDRRRRRPHLRGYSRRPARRRTGGVISTGRRP